MAGEPIDRRTIQLAAAKTAVSSDELPELVRLAQVELSSNLTAYRRRYECVHEAEGRCVFLVEDGHWSAVAAHLHLESHEADALRYAHEEQLKRIGRRADREAEFEAALEIREAAIVATA